MAIVITKRQKEGIAKAMHPLVVVSPTPITNMADEPEDGSSLNLINAGLALSAKQTTGIEWTRVLDPLH